MSLVTSLYKDIEYVLGYILYHFLNTYLILLYRYYLDAVQLHRHLENMPQQNMYFSGNLVTELVKDTNGSAR